ncbi:RNA 2',3'-cyclic phosphodiesterase [Chloroflexota bacterium]
MEQIRGFIAIELPPEITLKLGQLQAQMKAGEQPWVKWVKPKGIHLTLKFLGNMAAANTAAVTRAIKEATAGINPFPLEVKDLGVFPNPKRVQVAWVGINGEVAKLNQIKARLDANLAPLGFTPEARPFTPHLTLARLKIHASPEQRQNFGRLITASHFEAGEIMVDAVSLMQSQLTPDGAIYTQLSSVRLG